METVVSSWKPSQVRGNRFQERVLNMYKNFRYQIRKINDTIWKDRVGMNLDD